MTKSVPISPPDDAPLVLPGTSTTRVWIYKPWIDLVIGCGAWSAPLLLLTGYIASSNTASWSFGFYLLALLFNYPHFMATIYRAYHSYEEFAKYRFFTVHVAILLAITGVVAHLWYPLLPWIFTLYIYWSPWHYTGQNYGLLMMFARRAGLSPTETERQALHLSFIASFLLLMLNFHTGSSNDSLIISLGLPAKFTLPARAVALWTRMGPWIAGTRLAPLLEQRWIHRGVDDERRSLTKNIPGTNGIGDCRGRGRFALPRVRGRAPGWRSAAAEPHAGPHRGKGFDTGVWVWQPVPDV